MDIELLQQLQEDGYRYLFKKYGDIAFHPIKEVPDKLSVTPLQEDTLVSLEDALTYAKSEELKDSFIVLE